MAERIEKILERFRLVREASYDKQGVPIAVSEEEFLGALAEAWADSHEHCLGTSCRNPWGP